MASDTAGPPSVTGCTAFRLRKLSRRVSQHYDGHLAAAGLRSTQFSLLSVLMGDVPPTLTQLADTLEMDRTTLTRNLKPLATAGWVRTSVGDDGRSRTVHITEEGRARWRAGRPLWREAQRSLHTALGLPQVERLHQALDDALAHLPAH
ncbi:winged helix-turn-helix transcriptional regulator [Verticiella sediminum]|uniref:Winged helix-turn-helix transcriptional regulator n=2 Tax=Verticiella sediminum TaxID=1247510 RepID=A0A556ASC6_9BURK|nr:winged helix-turn-helix transcriptional regulator [Verticiella sediminum]